MTEPEEPEMELTPEQWSDMLFVGGPLGLLLIPLAKVLVWVKERVLRR